MGDLALMRKNNQVGTVKELRGRKVILQFGLMPITVDLDDLVVVKQKEDVA